MVESIRMNSIVRFENDGRSQSQNDENRKRTTSELPSAVQLHSIQKRQEKDNEKIQSEFENSNSNFLIIEQERQIQAQAQKQQNKGANSKSKRLTKGQPEHGLDLYPLKTGKECNNIIDSHINAQAPLYFHNFCEHSTLVKCCCESYNTPYPSKSQKRSIPSPITPSCKSTTFNKSDPVVKRIKYTDKQTITPPLSLQQRRLPITYRKPFNPTSSSRRTFKIQSAKERQLYKRIEIDQCQAEEKKQLTLEKSILPLNFALRKSVEELTQHFQQVEYIQNLNSSVGKIENLNQIEKRMTNFDRSFTMSSSNRSQSPEVFLTNSSSKNSVVESEASSISRRMAIDHQREGSLASDDRSQKSQRSSIFFGQPEAYRSIKGKGGKTKSSSAANAWDEEEKGSKSFTKKTSSKWKAFGSNKGSTEKRSSQFPRTSSIDSTNSANDLQRLNFISSIPPNFAHERTSSLQGSTFEICRAPIPEHKSDLQLFKGMNASLKYSENENVKSNGLQEVQNATSPVSFEISSKRVNLAFKNSVAPTRACPVVKTSIPYLKGSNHELSPGSIGTPALLRDIDVQSAMPYRGRAISQASSSMLPSLSPGTKSDSGRSMESSRNQGLLSPISTIDSPEQTITPKRVSKNLNVQTLRDSAQEIQEALRDSDGEDDNNKPIPQKQRIGSALSNQSQESSSYMSPNISTSPSTPSQSFEAGPQTTLRANGVVDDVENEENVATVPSSPHKNDQSLKDSLTNSTELTNDRTSELKAYSNFLTELKEDLDNMHNHNGQECKKENLTRTSSVKKGRQSYQEQGSSSQLPRRSCASLTSDQSVLFQNNAISNKKSETELSDGDKSEYSHSSGKESVQSNDEKVKNRTRQNGAGNEGASSKANFSLQEEEVLQSSTESSTFSSNYGETVDVANMEVIECSIQSARRLEISTAATPLPPRLIRSESQQSLVLLQVNKIKKGEQSEVKEKESVEENKDDSTESLSSSLVGEEKKFPKMVTSEIQRVNIIPATSKESLHVSLSWNSTIDLRRFKQNHADPISSERHSENFQDIQGNLRLREEDIERVARAWINSQLCEDRSVAKSHDSKMVSGRVFYGFSESELTKLDEIVLEQRQREILAGKVPHSQEHRNEIREKISNVRVTATTNHQDPLLQALPEQGRQRIRSLHLKPAQNSSLPATPTDYSKNGGYFPESDKSKSVGNTPSVHSQSKNPFDISPQSRDSTSPQTPVSPKRFSPPRTLPYKGVTSTILSEIPGTETMSAQEKIRIQKFVSSLPNQHQQTHLQSPPPSLPNIPQISIHLDEQQQHHQHQHDLQSLHQQVMLPPTPKSMTFESIASRSSVTVDRVSSRSSETHSVSTSKRTPSRQSSKKSGRTKAMFLFNGMYSG